MFAPAPPARRLPRSVGGHVFGSDVEGYRVARIGYPTELYAAIRARCGGAPDTIEIGPGTGLATAELLTNLQPARLVAVEPDPALADHLHRAIVDPRLRIVAEPFASAYVEGRFDLACAAASFHWLDPDAAFARLRMVLRPGATLALWWNVYRQVGVGDEFADAVTPLLDDIDLPPSEGSDGHYSLNADFHREAVTGAGFLDFAAMLFRRDRILDAEGVRALYASYSYVRALPDPRREALLEEIVSLAKTEFGGTVRNVVLTPLYLATAP
ncbi:MAG TPA: class I SAM-dependent methyltransferase [Sphingomonas sp.]|nr:class I SAM-dependent methyltransferase [Sphingomonas sp.]